jgi:hypothetical protein
LSLNCGKRNLKHLEILIHWQPALLLDIQDDGGEVPYTHRREWSFFVRWLCGQFKTPGVYHIQCRLLRISLNSVRVRQFTNNLEQELLDDLVSTNMYAPGTYSSLLEDIYVRSLLLPLANKLRDLKVVGTTLMKILPLPLRTLEVFRTLVMTRRSSYLWKLNSCRNRLWKLKGINYSLWYFTDSTCLHRQEHTSKTLLSSRGKQRPSVSHVKHNLTCTLTMGQDYPITRPSPGSNFPIHPPSPTLAWRDLPEVSVPLGHLFISFEYMSFNNHL